MATYTNIKSVILDIADHWGDTYYMGIRQIDFYSGGSKISLTAGTDFTAYATTTLSNDFLPKFAFDTATSYTGNHTQECWLAGAYELTDQRLIIVFDSAQDFDSIVVNNYHGSGSAGGVNTTRGAKNVVIHGSTDEITNTTYEASISNSIKLFDGQFDQHVSSDVQDDQVLDLIEPGPEDILTGAPIVEDLTPVVEYGHAFTAKSVIIDIADQWGDPNYLGVRQIDFYHEGSKLALTESDFTAYASSQLSTDFYPKFAFDTTTSYTGDHTQECWLAAAFSITEQRLIVVFNSNQTFDSIVINNYHGSGTGGGVNTTRGLKNIVIHSSTDSITDTTYEASITNDIKLFDGQIEQHSAVDEQDDQVLTLIQPGPESILTGIPVVDDLTPAIFDGPNMTAKSIILDIVNNWGNPTYTGLRSVEFYKDEVLVPLDQDDYTAQATTTYTAVDTDAEYIFDTSLSKTGNFYPGVAWLGATTGSCRISVVFNTPIEFDLLVINNHHENGAGTIRGIKDVKIYASDDSVTSTTYDADTENYDLIFDGRILQHIESDEADDQIVSIVVPAPSPLDILTGAPVISPVTASICKPENILAGAPVVGELTVFFIPLGAPDDIVTGNPIVPDVVAETDPFPEDILSGTPVISTVTAHTYVPESILTGTPAVSDLTAEYVPESSPLSILAQAPIITPVFAYVNPGPVHILAGIPIVGPVIASGITGPESITSGVPQVGDLTAWGVAIIPDVVTGLPDISPVTARMYIIDYTQATQHYVCHVGNKVVPITSFQCRLQADARTFLQVVVPGLDYASIIADSADELLIVQSVLKVDKIARSRHTIVDVTITDIRIDEGPLNQSISISGYKDPETTTKQFLNVTGSTYRRLINGKITHRFAEPNTDVRPGDDITVDTDNYIVGNITYYARMAGTKMQTSMEITEA